MIPKSGKSPADSRKPVSIHEFAALARSSFNGISQAVRDHVTKPTSLAQGRVAHLIEWKGWPKPADPSAANTTHFSSYCHLTEGEKEARFAAGVAEQFAIAEAKLRAWASIDDDEEEEEEEEDSNDEEGQDSHGLEAPSSNQVFGAEVDVVESSSLVCAASPSVARPPETSSPPSASDCMSPFLEQEQQEQQEVLGGHEEQPAPLEQQSQFSIPQKPEWRPRGRSSRFDSCYSTSHSESPGEEEEDEEEEEGSVFHEVPAWTFSPISVFSDRASSGVASFDEGEEEEEERHK